ncbi:hypothetical protein METY_3494 [Methylopila sp. Yamaguchi]|nr:hypothetical protein METY_3494 [Methylopila sp. Yamaguchi]
MIAREKPFRELFDDVWRQLGVHATPISDVSVIRTRTPHIGCAKPCGMVNAELTPGDMPAADAHEKRLRRDAGAFLTFPPAAAGQSSR